MNAQSCVRSKTNEAQPRGSRDSLCLGKALQNRTHHRTSQNTPLRYCSRRLGLHHENGTEAGIRAAADNPGGAARHSRLQSTCKWHLRIWLRNAKPKRQGSRYCLIFGLRVWPNTETPDMQMHQAISAQSRLASSCMQIWRT